MLGRLFLLFTLVPVLELWLLISIGEWLGALPTIAVVVITGFAGAALAKREGFRVLRSWQEASARGELPKDGIISSVLVLVGGILLVTPGVITDLVGLTLLIPGARRIVAGRIRGALEKRFALGGMAATGLDPSMVMGMHDPGPDHGEVIDVEARDSTARAEDQTQAQADAKP